MRKLFAILVVLAVVGAGALWLLSAPVRLSAEAVAALPEGDATRGETVFWASGCTSCHAAPGAKGDDKLLLAGGLELPTPFGTFRAPNISPHESAGIGGWSLADFANSMKRGVSPGGEHHYPAFPYTSYTRMTGGDVADLFAYLKTLPASDNRVADHDLTFPYNLRRGLGLWKHLYLKDEPILALDTSGQSGVDEQHLRGRYLVEVLGHCGECHTPRNVFGGMDTARWLAGGEGPETNSLGKPELIPNITPHETGIGDWSADDIAYSLESGFTPSYDSFGSSMVSVQENMARLSAEDREAIGLYLKAVRPIASDR
ncbi:MAG: cytochrome c [Ahrensia sp.]|nr:cytochrome c [Ahrensia sp.]